MPCLALPPPSLTKEAQQRPGKRISRSEYGGGSASPTQHGVSAVWGNSGRASYISFLVNHLEENLIQVGKGWFQILNKATQVSLSGLAKVQPMWTDTEQLDMFINPKLKGVQGDDLSCLLIIQCTVVPRQGLETAEAASKSLTAIRFFTQDKAVLKSKSIKFFCTRLKLYQFHILMLVSRLIRSWLMKTWGKKQN